MHLAPLIVDLAIILVIAGLMSLIFQKLKQPVVVGYILSGLIIGPYTPPFQLVKDIPTIQTWAELGVIFLMFTLGLEFSFRKLLSVGLTAAITASFEVFFFLFAGYGLGKLLGWSNMDSVFLGAMLSISSTTIIIKALDELKLKKHKFANLIFGVLIVEDLFAILMLVGLTKIATSGEFSFVALAYAGLNLMIVVGGWFLTGYFLVPRFMNYVSRKGNNELVTLVSLGFCLSLVVIASYFGYSAALGAFIMGSILAETTIIHQIENLMAPLKDLFGAIFFVSIGMLIDPAIFWQYKGTIAILCLFTIVGKILITTSGSLLSGQNLKNSVQVGFGLAQIGEFSFIIASLGVALKATSEKLYPIAVAVSLITTFTTPYLIKASSSMADRLSQILPGGIKNLLEQYVDWCEHKKGEGQKYQDVLKFLFKWTLNGLAMTLVFKLSFKNLPGYLGHMNFVLLIAFVLASPFLWGMLYTSKENYHKIGEEKSLLKVIAVMTFPILTSIWMGILLHDYYELKYIALFTVVVLLVVYFTLFKKLGSYYQWLENNFTSTFKTNEKAENKSKMSHLAPWDYHLVNVKVHPNAIVSGKSLMQANLRKGYGINVVAIERGNKKIVTPKATEMIFPDDVLVLLGTDKDIDGIKDLLETPAEIPTQSVAGNYKLKHMKIRNQSDLSGKTIMNSNLKENYEVMIMGVERNNEKIINPDSLFSLKDGDILWLVGEQSALENLIQKEGV